MKHSSENITGIILYIYIKPPWHGGWGTGVKGGLDVGCIWAPNIQIFLSPKLHVNSVREGLALPEVLRPNCLNT